MNEPDKSTILANAELGKPISIWVDIEKAETDEKGERIIYGRASDESVDLEGHSLSSSSIEKSLDYFLKYGKLDYDHKSKKSPGFIIGEPLKAEVKNKEFFLKGKLYKGVKVADEVWELLKAGGKMGFSVAGKILAMTPEFDKALGAEVQKISKVLLTSVAITPHPINFNTYCKPWGEFAKSLAKEGAESKLTEEEEEELRKALTTAEGSGKPLIGQSLEQKVHKTTYGDDKDEMDERKKKLSNLKDKLKSLRRKKTMNDLDKSIDALEQGIDDLEKAIKREDEDENEDEGGQPHDATAEGKGNSPGKQKVNKYKKPKAAAASEDEGSRAQDEDEDEDENEDEGAEASEKDDDKDGDEEMGGEGGEKRMAKAFEVSPILRYVGKQLEKAVTQNNDLRKAVHSLTKTTIRQNELIKSLSERIEEVEEAPMLRKSVAHPTEKRGAGEEHSRILSKSGEMDMTTILEKAIKKELPGYMVAAAELGVMNQ